MQTNTLVVNTVTMKSSSYFNPNFFTNNKPSNLIKTLKNKEKLYHKT